MLTKRVSRTDSGAAAVEFALISLIMLTLVAAIIQMSIWFWSYQVASHAAREGARRFAVEPCSTTANQNLVIERVGGAADGSVTVAATFSPSTWNIGDNVQVSVTFNTYNVTGGVIPMPTEITKTATARIEDDEGC